MTNTDKIIDYILNNTTKITADKIRALAEVIRALGGEVVKEPNEVQDKSANDFLNEEQPMNLNEIENIEIEGVGSRNVKIYQ